jgi:beta-galactosidase
MIDVPVMTNYGRVELLVNGRSMGVREVRQDDAEQCLPVWKIPFEAGELRARALDGDGNILQEDVRRTPGETARLLLTAEEETLRGDGHDLAFITVQAEDGDGNPVDNARDRVRITVRGGAYLIGTDNGDSTDEDGYKQNCRKLFGGKLLVMIASDGTAEDAVITAESTAGIRAELRLPVIPAEKIPGTSCLERIPEEALDRKIPVRKIEICAEENTALTKTHPACCFRWKQLPENAEGAPVRWQVTNDLGIETPFAAAQAEDDRVTVTASGDGHYCLRALGGNAKDHPEIISQIEFTAEGLGNPALDPYQFVSAGLYDLHDGDIGTGNEKGIAFARDGESMAGFSRVDFGKAGSDTLILPIFALDGAPYEIELFDGDPRTDGRRITVLHYEKPSQWNVYQEETYRLPERLTGLHCLCFRMREKVHMKGFRFERQSRAFAELKAGEADTVYGDSFRRDGTAVRDIGNNVSLDFGEMDFGDVTACRLVIRGRTDLETNAITLRIRNEQGEETTEVADFRGNGGAEQVFPVRTPGGLCSVTFVFLPGSAFDFEAFRFEE